MSKSRYACPGRCGRFVQVNRFACRACLRRLPSELSRPVVALLGKPNSLAKRRASMHARTFFDTRGRRTA